MRGAAGFRRRDAATLASRDFGPNMTPMVDIVMVILIFFMAGSAFIGPEWFLTVGMSPGADARPADQPRAQSLDIPAARVVLRLSVAGDGATRINGLGLTDAPLDRLSARLQEYASTGASRSVHVVVEPTTDTPYQDVIRVYDLCERAGFAGVGLAKARQGP